MYNDRANFFHPPLSTIKGLLKISTILVTWIPRQHFILSYLLPKNNNPILALGSKYPSQLMGQQHSSFSVLLQKPNYCPTDYLSNQHIPLPSVNYPSQTKGLIFVTQAIDPWLWNTILLCRSNNQ